MNWHWHSAGTQLAFHAQTTGTVPAPAAKSASSATTPLGGGTGIGTPALPDHELTHGAEHGGAGIVTA